MHYRSSIGERTLIFSISACAPRAGDYGAESPAVMEMNRTKQDPRKKKKVNYVDKNFCERMYMRSLFGYGALGLFMIPDWIGWVLLCRFASHLLLSSGVLCAPKTAVPKCLMCPADQKM